METVSSSYGVTYKNLWWTSTWPLLLVSMVAAIGGGPSERPAVAGAFFWGSVFAGLYAKNPTVNFRRAFWIAARVAAPVQAAFGLVLYFVFSHINPDISLIEVLASVLVSALLASAVWAFFIVRKGRKLLRMTDAERHEQVLAHEAEPSPRGKMTVRHRLALVFSTGWGRLGVVAWAAWLIWRWVEVDDSAGWRWESDDYLQLALQGVIAPIVVAVIVYWVGRGFLSSAERKNHGRGPTGGL